MTDAGQTVTVELHRHSRLKRHPAVQSLTRYRRGLGHAPNYYVLQARQYDSVLSRVSQWGATVQLTYQGVPVRSRGGG